MRYIKRYIGTTIILGAIFLAWFVFSRNANPLFLPKPERVWENMTILYSNGTLMKSIGYSLSRITVATMCSGLVSIPIALIAINFRWLDQVVTWFIGLMRYIPVTVFYPLLIMWLGIGEEMKITFLFVATFVYFLPSVVLCIKDTDSNLIDTAMTMGMSRLQVAWKVMLPYTLPSICQTFLMMYGIGWTYVIIVEVVNARFGLGHILNLATSRGNSAQVYGVVLIILLFSYVFDTIGKKLIYKAFPWKFASEVKNNG